MLKKKNRVIVNARVNKNEHIFTPDFLENMSLDEKDRTQFVIRRFDNLEKLDIIKTVEGKVQQDKEKTLRTGIVKVINPPFIIANGKEREMTLDDLVNIDELYILALQVYAEIVNFNQGRIDKGE